MSTLRANRFENVNQVGYTMPLWTTFLETNLVSTHTATGVFSNAVPTTTTANLIGNLSVNHTAKSATNILHFTVVINGTPSAANYIIFAAFKDAGANAIRTTVKYSDAGAALPEQTVFQFALVAGDTNSHSYSFGVGMVGGGTFTVNGSAGAGLFGGTFYSSVKIEEQQV